MKTNKKQVTLMHKNTLLEFNAGMFGNAMFIAPHDDWRQWLQGVFIKPSSFGGVNIMATDGHRLIYFYDELGSCSFKKGINWFTTKSVPSVTRTGYVHGIADTPPSGTDITTWRAGTTYKLQLTSGSWDRDVDENSITVTNPTFSGKIIEVINDTEVLVDTAYNENNIVFSCGSGVTACVLALAYSLINDKYHPCIYDGSWAEYGMV